MRRRTLTVIAAGLLAILAGCAEETPDEVETEFFSLHIGEEQVASASIPIDLSSLETELLALESAGGGFFSGRLPLGTTFSAGINTTGHYSASQSTGAFYSAKSGASTVFSASASCDFAGELCALATSLCYSLGPMVPESEGFDSGQCAAIDCGAISAELSGIFLMLPADLRCAVASVLSCLTPHIPTLAGLVGQLLAGGEPTSSDIQATLANAEQMFSACAAPFLQYLDDLPIEELAGSLGDSSSYTSSNGSREDEFDWENYDWGSGD